MQRVLSGELPFQPTEGGLTAADVGKRVEVAGPEGTSVSMFGYLRYVGPQVMVASDGTATSTSAMGHFSRITQLFTTPHAPCDMLYLVPMLIGC